MERRFDVIVIGGGVVGMACANALLDAGRSTCVLEREELGNGASPGNCGLLTPSHALPLTRPSTLRQALGWIGRPNAPFYLQPRLDMDLVLWGLRFLRSCGPRGMERAMKGRSALLERSLEVTRGWIGAGGFACEWQEGGLLEVYEKTSALKGADEVKRILAEHGLEAQRLSAQETRDREPSLREGIAGGMFHPRDAYLRPDRFLDQLAEVVRSKGGGLETHCTVTEIRSNAAGVRILTDRGDWVGHHAVLAAGAWSPDLAKDLGMSLPIQAGKGYSLTLPRPEQAPHLPLLLHEANMVVSPWPSGLRLGGTMELSGRNMVLRPKRLQALRDGARRFITCDVDGPGEEWVGWRPMTPDELPVIGPAPAAPRVLLATGHGMMGVSMCAATGELVAQLVTGAETGLDPAPYSPGRFGRA